MKHPQSELAIHGGPKAVTTEITTIFKWPIITREDENAVLDVLRRGAMSGTDETIKFEEEFANWQGTLYALACNNGTAALQSALYGCGISVGDEIICPSLTYWASALPVFALGASVVFADIDPVTLCLNPRDIEHRISANTRAIVVVHFLGHPADMDPIMAIANRHKLKVVEDVSHAHGGLYKGRKLGTIGDVAGMSMMSGKSFAIGEGGMLTTNSREIYERALAFGHYERFNETITTPELSPYRNLPLGGYKYRMHQLSSAVGRVQLKHYDERVHEIRRAMNFFWDELIDVPGLHAHRVNEEGYNTMAGWYMPHGLYAPNELGGLSVTRFAEAVRAEGSQCTPGTNKPLHLHPLLTEADVYGHDRPTRIAHASRDLIREQGSLPVSEQIGTLTFGIPWFKQFDRGIISEHANAYRKVAAKYRSLLDADPGNPSVLTNWPSVSVD